MNLIRRAWKWLTTPRQDRTQELLREIERTDQDALRLIIEDYEGERKAHVATLPEPPDMTDDIDTDVPEPHLGRVQQVDLTRNYLPGQPVNTSLEQISPSDWDLLTPDEKALFEQITPRNPQKTIAYPAPVEQSTADWVTEQLAKAGYSESYHRRFVAFRRVGSGMSMRYLGELKARAERKDGTLTVHQLLALRSRGIS